MRLARLSLLAYGPFRGVELDLGAPGLHVVFGKNEAGKSTTLRAIRGLLYGIDERTTDAHLHKMTELRIGAELIAADGTRLRVVRRKGKANTLLAPDGTAIDEAALAKMLGGISEKTFEHAFGLDHVTLRTGAQALLDGRGDLGESLFDASVGGGGEVQKLLAKLNEEADAIFLPRGSTKPLNEALKTFSDAQKSVRELQRLPDAYLSQLSALEEAKASRESLAAKKSAAAARKLLVVRARHRIPLERRRDELATEAASLDAIAKAAERIEALASRLAGYASALDKVREQGVEIDRLRDRIADASRRAGVDDPANALRVDARKEGRLHRLASDRASLVEKLEAARDELVKAERDLARVPSADAAAADEALAALAIAYERARALGDVETRHASDAARLAKKRKELEARAAQLGLFEGTLDALVALKVPAVATIERLAKRSADAERIVHQRREKATALENEAASNERLIAEQSGDFAPPSKAELEAARKRRDEALAAVRAGKGGAKKNDSQLELLGGGGGGELERAIRDADELADRMIREADRVTTLARLHASEKTIAKQRDEARSACELAEKERAAIDDEHRALFAPLGIAPLGFAEMVGWLGRQAQLVELHRAQLEAEGDHDAERATVDEARSALAKALGEDGRLGDLVAKAKARLDRAESAQRAAKDAARDRERLEKLITDKRTVVEKTETALAAAREELATLVVPLGLPLEASVDEVTRALEAARELFKLVDERASAAARLTHAERDARAFEEELARLLEGAAPDLAQLPPRDAAAMLVKRHQRAELVARDLAKVRNDLDEAGEIAIPDDVAALVADADAAQRAIDDADAELEELGREYDRVAVQLGSLEKGLEQLRTETGAADASARAQESLAKIRTQVDRYTRAKLAAVLLGREIDRYREENQGPLLSSASKLFSRLTNGAFTGVRAGFDDKDRPALSCVRQAGGEVGVAGLSEGTRDQLYLSLRLASVLRHAEVGTALPLVLDDILIHFDDDRARAALSVLAEVAQSLQVVFFTHHARLVELVRDVAREATVHELDRVRAAAAEASTPAT